MKGLRPLVVQTHVAELTESGGLDALVASHGPLMVLVGRSWGEALDAQFLGRFENSFVVTFDPLARPVARRLQASVVPPLGMLRARSMLLPVAIRNAANATGELAPMRVTHHAACAAFRKANASSIAGGLCAHVREVRWVWSVSLAHALGWIDRQVRYAHIDTRSSDLDAVRSAGARLRDIDYLSLGLRSDDCAPWYVDEPTCSEALAELRALGLVPAAEVRCRPRWPRVRESAFCRLRAVFRRPDLPAPPPFVLEQHRMHLNGCDRMFTSIADAERQKLLLATPGFRVGERIRFRRGNAWHNSSMGVQYACPRRCFMSATFSAAACPWA